jgi:hypothetical protein
MARRYILALAVVACFVASASYAEEIVINDAYTTNYMNFLDGTATPVTEFQAGTPVLYVINYDIVGDPGTKYRVAIIVKSSGDKIRFTETHGPGENIVSLTTNVVRGDDVGPQTVKYVVKLKERGVKGVLDQDSATSEISVE